jgi:uncharacterized protein
MNRQILWSFRAAANGAQPAAEYELGPCPPAVTAAGCQAGLSVGRHAQTQVLWSFGCGSPARKVIFANSGDDAEVTDDALLALLRALTSRVAGITDIALASRDGLIITADATGAEPDNLAALAAAALGIAQRMTADVGHGTLQEVTTRASRGCVTVYAVGALALLVVVGDKRLDVARLRRESRPTVEAIEVVLKRGQPDAGGSGAAAS